MCEYAVIVKLGDKLKKVLFWNWRYDALQAYFISFSDGGKGSNNKHNLETLSICTVYGNKKKTLKIFTKTLNT